MFFLLIWRKDGKRKENKGRNVAGKRLNKAAKPGIVKDFASYHFQLFFTVQTLPFFFLKPERRHVLS